ncbi:thioredoxin-domain-containing protein [Trametes coccinea BRFM310]|uniref:Thioredoxin-domain-containing protein n=1 Tax=Trametes coccinea (strain BRFM310) TaxID=1353009 RepID=A0A1Y2ILI7_TRAC3|nr:thioredoxin-domain-containing protein [Trametes coccinea BRFM310]
MRLFSLAKLSFSLLASSVILASTALPVESSETELLVLTPDNFASTIAEGVWFIEHFSPYCGHCRRFAPTWKQLVEETEAKPDPGIHLAQVNCAVHGDLCNKNKVDGYPQMNLYRNGQLVEVYRKARTIELLTEYLNQHAEPRNPPAPAVTTTAAIEQPTPTAAEKDELAEEVKPREDVNPRGLVLSLDESTFQANIDKGGVFVKFFAPWCGHCKKLAPTWTQLAGQMKNKLNIAEVNCEEHNALCRQEGVTGYPMLFYYGGKGTKTEYTGGRKLEQLKAFAEKVSGPGVQELKFGDLNDRAAEHSVLYLLLHSPSDRAIFNQAVEASHILFGSPPLFTSTASAFYDHYNIQPGTAAIIAIKDNEPNVPAAVYTFSRPLSTVAERQDLVDWLLRNRFPTALELDSDNFQDVMNAPHKPLVVIVGTPRDALAETAQQVRELARRWRDAREGVPVVFTWMDADKWGSWLKSMYGIKKGALPRAIVANHSSLVYYETDQFGEPIRLTSASLFSAINGAAKGTIPYKHSENIVERLARYLNQKLISLETFVANNPWHTAFYALIALGLFGLLIRRLLADTEPSREGGYLRKEGRLD